jgi:hypothetical protein
VSSNAQADSDVGEGAIAACVADMTVTPEKIIGDRYGAAIPF